MRRIINLILLQFQTVFELKKYMLLITAIAIFMAIIEPDMLPFAGALFIMATCYNTAFYEEKSKINYLIYSLPIKEKEYILSKYIFVAINTFISMAISAIIYIGMVYFNILDKTTMVPLWAFMLMLLGIGIFMMSILTPLEILLGFEKARIALVFLTVFPVVFSTNIVSFLPTVNLNNNIFKVLIALCVVTLILASYFITSNMYVKKDI
ncbi:ABC-2 transporter permease [Clostridium sp.]|uniref:ABC-2 transporter permease n=1 Tax=Clostridium sp. TaxID=1506 RepID=UPI0029132F64|nr:ABC-2 transporter permease [Clostridium sp.]MDU5107285.1 ABC-2 transporter permease [Clostridium sp.]